MATKLWTTILLVICYVGCVVSNQDDNCTTLDLHYASAIGNLAKIRQILDDKIVDVNCKQIFGPPAKGSDPGCAGCKRNMNVDNGTTALHYAVKEQQKEAVELLLSRGADVNARRNDGWTALHYAANNGNEEIASLLIFYGADVNAQMNAKSTPLHFASYKGHKAVLRLLLEKGADPNVEKDLGYTAIYEASLNGFYDIVKLLLDNGALFDTLNEEGTSPWHAAIIGGHYNIVKLFIDNGIDLNLKRNDEASGLHDAAYFGRTDIVKLLLDSAWDQNKGKLNLNLNVMSISEKVKPVGVAALRGNTDIVKLLLDYGADIVANARGLTVYDFAKYSSNSEDITLVLDRLETKPVEEWNVDDVCYWVSRLEQPLERKVILKLPRKTSWIFRQKKVDGISLLRLDHDSVRELGITDGPHQELLLQKLHEAKHRHGHIYWIAGATLFGIVLLLILVWKKSTGPTQDPAAPKTIPKKSE